MNEALLSALLTFNRILTAGNTITTFSLLLYALTFNLRQRVARAFAVIMALVTSVYLGDLLAGTSSVDQDIQLWLRFSWIGISFVPAAYLQLSDALLEATGRPSRGRRRAVVAISYFLASGFFAMATLTQWIVGDLKHEGSITYLEPGPVFPLFVGFALLGLGFAAINFLRAFNRCLTRTSQRRMRYLGVGALGPILATWPFLVSGGSFIVYQPFLFWLILLFTTVGIACMLIMMAYAVAYFGVSFPDRVVKSRLFQWILRGPVVASTTLAVWVIANRVMDFTHADDSRVAPVLMIGTLLLLQYLITLMRQPIERWLFYGQDREDVIRLQALEERLLTTGDLQQFLEGVLHAVCDIVGVDSAFIAVVTEDGLDMDVAVGPNDPLRGSEDLPTILLEDQRRIVEHLGPVFLWHSYWLIPLSPVDSDEAMGLMGLRSSGVDLQLDEAEAEALNSMIERATIAITERVLQREVFSAVDRLVPEVEELQRMRAAARYAGVDAFTSPISGFSTEADLVGLVKDALTHYWGGPRLTESPLLNLRVVRESTGAHQGNPVNALRSILRRGIERVRPAGERRFTGEWMLYNILDMKFLEGRKVRDVALRLAMSEADLYRKQRVAIAEVAKAIADMEHETNQELDNNEDAS